MLKVIGEMICVMIFFVLVGIVVVFVYKIGFFNIGVEGQFLVGWLVLVWVGYVFDLLVVIYIFLVVLVVVVVGVVWVFILGFLKVKFYVYEVIVFIMMNYIVFYIMSSLICMYLYVGNEKLYDIKELVFLVLSFLVQLINNFCFYYGIFVIIVVVVVMWFILNKIVKGFELRVVGFN